MGFRALLEARLRRGAVAVLLSYFGFLCFVFY